MKAVFYKAYNPRPYRGGDAATFAYGSVWNKLIRREILVDNQIRFDESVFGIFDDVIFSAYILAAAKKVAYIQKNVYYYRMLDNSITHTYKGNMLEINQAIFNSWDTFLQKYDPKGIYKSACYANILRRFDDSLTRYFFNDDNPKSKAEIIKELSVIIHSKPYCDIPKFVDKDLLGKRLRAECELIEKGSAQRVSLFYKLLSLYRRCR